ncbi:hypothetical protein ABMA27_014835 [Loxostege sticticalis]|uniref:Tick transposon n=1 Tax=Loxostege sticticalis TaxID=481309 RepID=A0ABR3IAD9_LOXSC
MCSPQECASHTDPNCKQIKILHVNIRSINQNFDELCIFLNMINVNVDIIILTECWLSKVINVPVLQGFNSYCSNWRNQNDGVIIFIREEMKCKVSDVNLTDASCLKICFKNGLAILGIYRSLSVKIIDNFLNSLNNLLVSLASFKTVTIIGDININILSDKREPKPDPYLNLLASHGLLPPHSFITHDDACLDHVMMKTNLKTTTIVSNFKFTDHNPVLTFIGQHQKSPYHKTRVHVNIQNVTNELANTDFTTISEIKDANLAADLLISKIYKCVKQNTKIVKVSCRNRIIKPWITPGLLRCIQNRNSLHSKMKKDPNNEVAKVTYLRYRNYCNKLLKKLKCLYERSEFQKAKNNPKATWNVIKSITHLASSSSHSTELLDLTNDPNKSVNQVNDFFVNIGPNLASKISKSQHISTDESEVEKIIVNLKTDSATGYDGISSAVIKAARNSLVPPITYVCNRSLFQKPSRRLWYTQSLKVGIEAVSIIIGLFQYSLRSRK